MTKSLNTLKTVAKIGRILSKIVFICCLVGGIFSLVGIVSLAIGAKNNIQIGDVNIHLFIEEKAEMSVNDLYTAMAVAIALCSTQAVLAKFSEKYFVRRLNGGTPFSADCADDTKKFGIVVIVLSLVGSFLTSLVHDVMAVVMEDVTSVSELNAGSSVWIGVMFLVLSVVFRAGLEQSNAKGEENAENQEPEEPFSSESK